VKTQAFGEEVFPARAEGTLSMPKPTERTENRPKNHPQTLTGVMTVPSDWQMLQALGYERHSTASRGRLAPAAPV